MGYFFTGITLTQEIETQIELYDFAVEFNTIIEKELKNAHFYHIYTEPLKIKFKGSPFRFAWNGFNLFNPVYRGIFELFEQGKKTFLRYHFNFSEFFLIACLFSIIPLTAMWQEWWIILGVALIIWISFIGGTLSSVFRFKRFLKKTVKEINSLEKFRKEIEFINKNSVG